MIYFIVVLPSHDVFLSRSSLRFLQLYLHNIRENTINYFALIFNINLTRHALYYITTEK